MHGGGYDKTHGWYQEKLVFLMVHIFANSISYRHLPKCTGYFYYKGHFDMFL